jgi:N-acetylmuramoyl-L-alanine amidase
MSISFLKKTRINKSTLIKRLPALLLAIFFTSATFAQYASAIDVPFFDSNKILYYDPTACDPVSTVGSGTLSGSDVEEKIWNWLVGNGLKAEQAAGIMGNMSQESTFVPTRTQAAGDLWDSAYGKGWGLVQWDGGRRYTTPDRGVIGAIKKNQPALMKYVSPDYDYFRNPSAKDKIPAADLDAITIFELEYMKQESESRATTAKGFGGSGKEWDTLKLQKTVENATVFWHQNFEVSADTAAQIQGRVDAAKKIFEKYKNNTGGTATSGSTATGKPVVFLDPGHGGAIPDYTDAKTGIVTNETANSPEREDVLQVANKVKSQLEMAGYTVVLSRTTNDAKVTFRERADAAAAAKASIGISIHTSPGGPSDAWSQHDGYREHDGKRDTFGDTDQEKDTMKASQTYAAAIGKARTAAEGHDVGLDLDYSHQLASFGRGGNIKSPGNIPLVALWSPTVPWVYNEIAQDGPNASITEKTKDAYAKGIVDGVKAALPGTPNTNKCTGSDFAGGDFNATLKAYAWPEYHQPNFLDKMPAYAKAVQKAQSEGRYVGGGVNPGIDCGGFITTFMIDSGFEPNYNYKGKGGPTGTQEKWLKENWQTIGRSDGIDVSKLKPGDVAINSDHTFMYVGKVDGFASVTASASYSPHNTSWRAPMAGGEAPNSPGYTWYGKR